MYLTKAKFGNSTVSQILCMLLDQAQSRGRVLQVARGLFAAKLEMLLERQLEDEEASSSSTSSDFHVGDAVFVLAITLSARDVVCKVQQLLRTERGTVWMIVRRHESSFWGNVIKVCLKPKQRSRVIVSDIETNIGITIMMKAGCRIDDERKLLAGIIKRYDDQHPMESDFRLAVIAEDANPRAD